MSPFFVPLYSSIFPSFLPYFDNLRLMVEGHVGACDHGLDISCFEEVHEGFSSFAVQLASDVVQKEDGVFAGFFFDIFHLGEFHGEDGCPLLALGAVNGDVHAVHEEGKVVSVRAYGGVAEFGVFFAVGSKAFEEPFFVESRLVGSGLFVADFEVFPVSCKGGFHIGDGTVHLFHGFKAFPHDVGGAFPDLFVPDVGIRDDACHPGVPEGCVSLLDGSGVAEEFGIVARGNLGDFHIKEAPPENGGAFDELEFIRGEDDGAEEAHEVFFTDRVVVEEDSLALVPRQFHFDGMRDVADGEVEEDGAFLVPQPDHFVVVSRAEGFPYGGVIDRLDQVRLPAAVFAGEDSESFIRQDGRILHIADLDQPEFHALHG